MLCRKYGRRRRSLATDSLRRGYVAAPARAGRTKALIILPNAVPARRSGARELEDHDRVNVE